MRKREEKQLQKQILKYQPSQSQKPFIVSKQINLNKIGNAKNLFKALSMHDESIKLLKSEQKKLNDYINPLLADKDPDNGIEEEYKHKYK